MKKRILGIISTVVICTTVFISCSNSTVHSEQKECLKLLGNRGGIYVYEDVMNGNIVYECYQHGIAVVPKHEVKGE